MVVEYFIKVVISVVFAYFVTMIVCFAGKKLGAMIAGGVSFASSIGCTNYSWSLSARQARVKKTAPSVSCA